MKCFLFQVSTETGLKWAKDHGLSFLETSAKSGNNVNKAFQTLLHDIYKKQTEGKQLQGNIPPEQHGTGPIWNSTVVLDGKATQTEEGCC